MLILLVALILLATTCALFAWLRSGESEPVAAAPSCSTCNGSDERCEQECLLEAATKDIVYFNDEELDRYARRRSDSYTEAEVAEFAEVLYTLRPDEIKAWGRSLTLRSIALPDELKDEYVCLTDNA